MKSIFKDYVTAVLMEHNYHFTTEKMKKDLRISDNAARIGISRLKKEKIVITPVNGLCIIVPPQDRAIGSVPADQLVYIMMNYLNADYYVGILSAGLYYGATHQKPARFQVITNRRIKHSMSFGKIEIDLVYRKKFSHVQVKEFPTKSGYLKVATPELIALDLFKYHKRAGGISHIATVLAELTPVLDVGKLIDLAFSLGEEGQLRRIGYVIEKIEVYENEENQALILTELEKFLKNSKIPFIPLVPYIDNKGFARCKKWKIIENTNFESDL